jgi:hypothetical protein
MKTSTGSKIASGTNAPKATGIRSRRIAGCYDDRRLDGERRSPSLALARRLVSADYD